ISAEYTDWSRAVQHPMKIRDLTGEALHDANLVSPMSILVNQLYTSARSTYLYVFDHNLENHHSDRMLSRPLNELSYVFGSPLGALGPLASGMNFTKIDVALSESLIIMWSNFIKVGHPNDMVSSEAFEGHRDKPKYRTQEWPFYDPVHRRFLELGSRGRVQDHYRAGRVALWSWLIPGLERVGSRYGPDSPFHRFSNHLQSDTFSGPTRPTNLSSNLLPPSSTLQSTTVLATLFPSLSNEGNESFSPASESDERHLKKDFPYSTALSVTVAIGCSLLVLNLLVFTAVYYRHDTTRQGFIKGSHGRSNNSANDVQLHATAGESCKSLYSTPAQYGTLRSSAILQSSLVTSFEGDVHNDWPPDYTSSCQSGDDDTPCVPGSSSKPDLSATDPHLLAVPVNESSGDRERILKRSIDSYTSPIDGQLTPNYSSDDTSDLHV
ncbi:hypothetical protein SK128_008454, partial [Halocaridina rubra]